MKKLSVLALSCLLLGSCCSKVANTYELIPYPNHLTPRSGSFAVAGAAFAADEKMDEPTRAIVADFAARMAEVAGTQAEVAYSAAPEEGGFCFRVDETLPAEHYALEVGQTGATLRASSLPGFIYGIQTLKQLLPAAVYGGEAASSDKWEIPCVSIEDAPRFSYRGLHLDVARHFFDTKQVEKVIDMMVVHKLNTLHWHLTEDQGWRIEIKKYPRLTEVGAWRNSRALGWGDSLPDEHRYGGYYTQEDIREIVAYARERFIEIIPEVDLPGHSQAAVAAYPEFLACDPQKKHEVWLYQGISDDVINVAHPRAVQFAKDVVDELAALFPFGYIHLGGDECPTRKWKENAECRALLKQIGSTNYRDLQIHFYKQLADHLAAKPAAQRRKLVFWNEVLHGNTAPLGNGITIMAWTGADEAALEAARRGLDNILTPQIPYYINRRQAPGPDEPMSQGNGTETVEVVYNYQPQKDVPANLARHYKGVQANFWTEWVIEPSVLEYLMLPRLAAVAEAAWTPQERRNYQDFVLRIRPDAHLYELKEWNYGKHIMH